MFLTPNDYYAAVESAAAITSLYIYTQSRIVIHSCCLHGDAETGLEGGHIRGRHAPRRRQVDLGSNFADQTRREDSVAADLGLDEANLGRIVRTAHGDKVAHFGGRVRRLTRQRQVAVDLVEEADVKDGKFGRGRDGRKDGARGVTRAHIDTGQTGAVARQIVAGIGAQLQTLLQSQTHGCGHIGHFHDIHTTGRVKVGAALDGGVIESEVGALSGLEGELDIVAEFEGRLEDLATVGGELTLVDLEFGIIEFGSNLGRQGTGIALLGFNGDSHGAGIFLALERDLGRVVLGQNICNKNS